MWRSRLSAGWRRRQELSRHACGWLTLFAQVGGADKQRPGSKDGNRWGKRVFWRLGLPPPACKGAVKLPSSATAAYAHSHLVAAAPAQSKKCRAAGPCGGCR